MKSSAKDKAELAEKVNALEGKVSGAADENDRLRQDLSLLRANKAENEAQASAQSSELQKELSTLKAAIKRQEDLLKAEKASAAARASDILRLQKELKVSSVQLSKVLAEAKSLKEANSAAKSSKKALKSKHAEAIKTIKSLKEKLSEASEVAEAKSNSISSLNKQLAATEAKVQAAEASQASMVMNHEQELRDFQSRMDQQLAEHEQALTSLKAEQATALSASASSLQQLEQSHLQEIAGLRADHACALQEVTSKVTKLEEDNTGLEKALADYTRQLDDRAYAQDKLRKECTDLKETVSSLNEQLVKLKEQHQEELRKLEQQSKASLVKAELLAESQQRALEQHLQLAHEKTVEEMAQSKAKLQAELDDARASLKASEEEAEKSLVQLRQAHEQLIEEEKSLLQVEVDRAVAAHEAEKASIVEDHTKQIALATQKAERILEEEKTKWQEETLRELEKLSTEMREKLQAAVEDKRVALERAEASKSALRYELEAKSSEQRLRLLETHNRQMEEQRVSMSASFDEKMRYLVNANTAQVAGLKKDLEDRAAALARAQAESRDWTVRHGDLQQELSRLKMEWRQQSMNAEEAHKTTMNNVISRYERAEKDTAARHLSDKAEWAQVLQEKDSLINVERQRVEQTVREWRHKYAHRESREEDVQEIQSLQQQLQRAHAQCRKAVEEMSFFKKELLNREENYNKLFGRAPNVGIMQVVPSRQPSARKTKIPASNLPPLGSDQHRNSASNNNNNRDESRPKRPGSASKDRLRRYSIT